MGRFARILLFALTCLAFLASVPASQAQVVVIGPRHHYRRGYYRHPYHRRYYRHYHRY